MAALAQNRKQRLRTLENQIRSGMEEFYYVGMKLKEIRDDELYKEDGFETWEKYCRERWEYNPRYVHRIIEASEYREKLPSGPSGPDSWSERSVRELTRIPDKKQAARVAAKIVKEVERSEKRAAKNPEVKPLKLSSTVVKKFVDQDLGIKPKANNKPAPQTYGDSSFDLPNYLNAKRGQIEGIIENLALVTTDAWERLEDKHPGSAERLAEACDELAELLRS